MSDPHLAKSSFLVHANQAQSTIFFMILNDVSYVRMLLTNSHTVVNGYFDKTSGSTRPRNNHQRTKVFKNNMIKECH